MVVELPPLFDLCLSREFTTKIEGYLAMDYTHYLVPYGDKRIRLENEKIFNFHVEKKEEVNAVMCEMEESDQLLEELQIEDPFSMNMLDTIHNMEFGNYCLIELEPFITRLTNDDFWKGEIWEMFFNDARSKNGSKIGIELLTQ